jgi:catechol-2,3-dioxygenase
MHILELEILTNNLNKTEQFYGDVLGLPVIAKSDLAISFLAGNTRLIFKYTGRENPIYHVAFNIPNNKLDESLDWMKSKVDILDAEPGSKIANFVNWNAKSFYFYDYNGNILEFIARYSLDNKTGSSFTGSSIICVSEIGLAADDVSIQCNSIIETYNIPVFLMQPVLPNFAAMGDDHGLLILSKVNRNWHLTENPAQKYYTKIAIINNNQTHSLSFYIN